ncbi:MAG: hypothetical protein PHV32_02700 [Eubacteriales bacterium]|nr:hypothetical protein [Eubacteriales bacterium]
MVIDNTRRIIVIKDVDSEYVQEAILVLRDGKKSAGALGGGKAGSELERDFLVKEAQRIIDDYIKDCKSRAGIRRNKYLKGAGKKIPAGFIICGSLILSVVLFIYLVMRIL